jgi:hypothetical protein
MKKRIGSLIIPIHTKAKFFSSIYSNCSVSGEDEINFRKIFPKPGKKLIVSP